MNYYALKPQPKWIVLFMLSFCFMIADTAFIFIFKDWISISVFVVLFLISFWFAFMGFCAARDYKVKFMLNKKQYKKHLEIAISKFETTDKEFIRNFKKETNLHWIRFGEFDTEKTFSSWIYRSQEETEKLKIVLEALYSSIVSKGGFVEAIGSLDDHELLSGGLYSYLHIDIVSCELRFLIKQVYNFSSFKIKDPGFSDGFTKRNNEKIEKLNNFYSPILFNFEEEVKTLLKKTKTALK